MAYVVVDGAPSSLVSNNRVCASVDIKVHDDWSISEVTCVGALAINASNHVYLFANRVGHVQSVGHVQNNVMVTSGHAKVAICRRVDVLATAMVDVCIS